MHMFNANYWAAGKWWSLQQQEEEQQTAVAVAAPPRNSIEGEYGTAVTSSKASSSKVLFLFAGILKVKAWFLKHFSCTSMAAFEAGAPLAAALAIRNLSDQASNERDRLSQSSRASSPILFEDILGSMKASVAGLHTNTSLEDTNITVPPSCATVHFFAVHNTAPTPINLKLDFENSWCRLALQIYVSLL
jgi:hypothetical protein